MQLRAKASSYNKDCFLGSAPAAINLSSNSPDKRSLGVANEAKERQKADDDIKQQQAQVAAPPAKTNVMKRRRLQISSPRLQMAAWHPPRVQPYLYQSYSSILTASSSKETYVLSQKGISTIWRTSSSS